MHKNSHNFFIKNGYIIFNLFNKNEIDLISKDIISRLKYLTNSIILFSKIYQCKYELNYLIYHILFTNAIVCKNSNFKFRKGGEIEKNYFI